MEYSSYEEILGRIRVLQNQLEQEFDSLLSEQRARFQYHLKKGRVVFNKGVRDFQKRYRKGIWPYLRDARPAHILTAPIIYSVIVPLLVLDLFVWIYQQTCFRVYGIPIVRRSDFIIIDRHQLDYLNAIEKLNCMYCGYGNGLIAYIREIFARTEQYWCPIKHARLNNHQHPYVEKFVDYGDAEAYRKKLKKLREDLKTANKT